MEKRIIEKKRYLFKLIKRRWQGFYLNLFVVLAQGPVRRTNKQRKAVNRQISYMN